MNRIAGKNKKATTRMADGDITYLMNELLLMQ